MATTQPQEERTTDRVSTVIPITVFGSDVEGRNFAADAHTLEVNARGALIEIDHFLTPMEEVVIRREESRREAVAQVLGRVRKESAALIYAIKLVDEAGNLWGIHFLPVKEADGALVRTLLDCVRCNRREVVYLEELEVEVYKANRQIFRSCPSCRETTIWKEACYESAERKAERPSPSVQPEPLPPPPPVRADRQHSRISWQVKGCIRSAGYGEEVLQMKDVSRGGVGFSSARHFARGVRIEVAVPYADGPANIFVPAEIARVREIPESNLREYGACYCKTFARRG